MLLGVVHNCQQLAYSFSWTLPILKVHKAISSGVLALLCFRPLVAKPRIRQLKFGVGVTHT
jgi:hypothetical protein